MLDYGASYNLISKVITERLGLDITRPYKDLYSFDSNKVKYLGLIKDLAVYLTQIPSKYMVMDIVVADMPPRYGMILSRTWMKKCHEALQIDMSYITVSFFGGQSRRLYREPLMQYMINSEYKPMNNPVYDVHFDLDSFVLFNSGYPNDEETASDVEEESDNTKN